MELDETEGIGVETGYLENHEAGVIALRVFWQLINYLFGAGDKAKKPNWNHRMAYVNKYTLWYVFITRDGAEGLEWYWNR